MLRNARRLAPVAAVILLLVASSLRTVLPAQSTCYTCTGEEHNAECTPFAFGLSDGCDDSPADICIWTGDFYCFDCRWAGCGWWQFEIETTAMAGESIQLVEFKSRGVRLGAQMVNQRSCTGAIARRLISPEEKVRILQDALQIHFS